MTFAELLCDIDRFSSLAAIAMIVRRRGTILGGG
jgi:hypothetical protein